MSKVVESAGQRELPIFQVLLQCVQKMREVEKIDLDKLQLDRDRFRLRASDVVPISAERNRQMTAKAAAKPVQASGLAVVDDEFPLEEAPTGAEANAAAVGGPPDPPPRPKQPSKTAIA